MRITLCEQLLRAKLVLRKHTATVLQSIAQHPARELYQILPKEYRSHSKSMRPI